MPDEVVFTNIPCSRCGSNRLSNGVCPLLPDQNGKGGCPDPTYDYRKEHEGRKEQPDPLDSELIEAAELAYAREPGDGHQKMAAAARVIADALLSPVADDEWISHDDGKTVQATRYGVNQILAKRRARIEAKPKTDAEKIADMLIAKGPDTPDAYRQVAAEIVEKLKADRTRVESR